MKKISIFLCMTLIFGLLAGCAGTPVVYYTECTCPPGSHNTTTTPSDTAKPSGTPDAADPAAGAVKTGLVISTNVKDSSSASAEDGEAKYDVTMVAVLVDDAGVIRDCVIDGIASSVNFDGKGKITSDLTAAPQTKNELGDKYGMVAWGGAIAEWDEQAAAFAAYVTGKTPAEVAGIAVSETTAPVEADLTASVTIAIGGFQALIAKAAQ